MYIIIAERSAAIGRAEKKNNKHVVPKSVPLHELWAKCLLTCVQRVGSGIIYEKQYVHSLL